MSLADSMTAIGAVSELLRSRLEPPHTSAGSVRLGRPEEAAGDTTSTRLNLFLFQIGVDGHLRNQPLDPGQPEPLWLVLRYLVTAFDGTGVADDSDTAAAHELLGEALIALHELNFLSDSSNLALADNPEPLKITFESADSELLSKLMQGAEEHYRVSAAIQVRPIMLASGVPPSYAPLVKTVGPADAGPEVLPSLGPKLDDVAPERFEAGDTITVSGLDLSSEVTEICLGAVCYGVTAAPAGRLQTRVPLDTTLSAGSYPICAVKPLASGRRLASNAVLGHLLPTLDTAATGPLTLEASGNVSGDVTLAGRRLGGPDDGIFAAFYGAGGVALMLEVTGTAAQTGLTLTVTDVHDLQASTYRSLLRVNGEQAANSPEVSWTP